MVLRAVEWAEGPTVGGGMYTAPACVGRLAYAECLFLRHGPGPIVPSMRPFLVLFAAAVVSAACAERDVRLRGSLAGDWTDDALFVSVTGGTETVPIEDGAFAIHELPTGPIELRIESAAGAVARMAIGDLPTGGSLALERIRFDEDRGLAFPSAIRVRGADRVMINGIWMAAPGEFPRRVDEAGVIVAIGEDGDALLVRPGRNDLPDLPVVITGETQVLDSSGAESGLELARAGDSVRVEGRSESGYVFARRLRFVSTPRTRPSEPGSPEALRDGQRSSSQEVGRDRRGADPQIPKGHRPPPGKCRDWNPNLPPGQQPPPRDC